MAKIKNAIDHDGRSSKPTKQVICKTMTRSAAMHLLVNAVIITNPMFKAMIRIQGKLRDFRKCHLSFEKFVTSSISPLHPSPMPSDLLQVH
jgi:hypothetical protein